MFYRSDAQRKAIFARMNQFADRDDALWKKVMKQKELHGKEYATDEQIEDYTRVLGDSMFGEQIRRDLVVSKYPLHDAIAMWIDSAGSLTDDEYNGVKVIANDFIDMPRSVAEKPKVDIKGPKLGVYETDYGNAVEYRGPDEPAYDLDMSEEVPIELIDFSRFIRGLDE